MKSIFDDLSRADLLCYLVIAQLISRVRGNEWLQAVPLVESLRQWSQVTGASPDGLESKRLGQVSEQLSRPIWHIALLRDAEVLAALFTDSGRLDYQSPIVRGITGRFVLPYEL